MKLNFLQKLINDLAPDVFRPVPTGILYTYLQAIAREISGECAWDTGQECYKGYSQYWYFKCRNSACPGYKHPTGLIAYTSESSISSSTDNRFDYSSFRYLTGDGNDWMPVGTLGAQIKFDFGFSSDPGGFGAGYFGAGEFGYNTYSGGGSTIVIGDSWIIACNASTGFVSPAYPSAQNKGSYSVLSTSGIYTGIHDTTYTVTIIDFWGYVQNFENALLQISLSDCTDVWLNYWGEYFGIPRLLLTGGYEDDETYRARIMKEITRAKTTKPILLEEARNYFNSDLVTITEYHQTPSANPPDGPVTDISDSAYGLWPWQFYINIPTQKAPSAKFIKDGTALIEDAVNVYVYEGGTGYYYSYGSFGSIGYEGGSVFGYGGFGHIGPERELFSIPTDVGDSTVYGCTTKFSGVGFTLTTLGVGGTYVWEYWNGNGWTTFVPGTTMTDATSGFTIEEGVFWLVPLKDWVPADNVTYNIPATGTNLYWARCRVVDPPSVSPVIDSIAILHVGSTNRGVYIGHDETALLIASPSDPASGYDPGNRDKNNIYIYGRESYEKPLWQSGLQEIIDRLKCAGTVAIINPVD